MLADQVVAPVPTAPIRPYARWRSESRRTARGPLARVGSIRVRGRSSSGADRSGTGQHVTYPQWHEVEDGVLWSARAEGVTPPKSRPGSQRQARASARRRTAGGQRRAGETPSDVIEYQHRGHAGTPARLYARRLGARQPLEIVARAGAARQLDVFRAGGGRAVHAARRRLRPVAAAARSGDAAFLLAVRRFFRRRSRFRSTVRSIGSTGSSTGATRSRRHCCRRCCCTSRWCSPNVRPKARERRTRPSGSRVSFR